MHVFTILCVLLFCKRSYGFVKPKMPDYSGTTLRFNNARNLQQPLNDDSRFSLQLPIPERLGGVDPLYKDLDIAAGFGCPARCRCTYRRDKTVHIVDCANTDLTEIPKLPTTPSEVYLQGNFISEIGSGQFRYLGALRVLDLSKNSLAKVPNATFQGLASLVFLSLQGNKLRYVRETFEPRAFQGLISLESLHLEGNQPDLVEDFTYPDQAVAQVPTLRHLWMDGFPRALDPGFSSLVQLSSINLSGHGGYCSMKSDISSSFFCHPATEHPYGVNMSVCDISGIQRDVFKCVPTIDSLDLYYNKRLFIDGFEKASEGLNSSRLSVLNISKTVQPFTPVSVVKKYDL